MEIMIKDLIGSLSVTAKYRGYPITVAACELLLEDELLLYSVNRDLYPKISARCGCRKETVERNIRTVILHIWDRNRPRLFEIAGYEMEVPPTVTEFLGILICYLQRMKMLKK